MPGPEMTHEMRHDTNPNMKEETITTYTARLEKEVDGRWSVELDEEPRVHTWGKTIDQALTRIREATALWFQTDEASIELVPRPVLPKATDRSVQQARKAREQARDADRQAIEQTRKAAVDLTGRGISIRDAAAILGISHQRVHQLLTPETPPSRKSRLTAHTGSRTRGTK
jgi:predicted RNase H-like HicB family nuclease